MARFSLKWLFVGMAVVAVYAAALANPNVWWLLGTGILTAALMAVAVLQGMLHLWKEPFWIGYAAFSLCSEVVYVQLDFRMLLLRESNEDLTLIASRMLSVVFGVCGGLLAVYLERKHRATSDAGKPH